MKLKYMLQFAIFAAILCIVSPLSVPIGTIPLTLMLFGVMLCAVVLPWQQSAVSVLLFLLLSLCGLPVFSGGNSGITALPGPTGGYIWSLLLVTPLISLLCQTKLAKKYPIPGAIVSCVLGLPLCYLCGTAQFSLLAGRTFAESLSLCVFPFILPDVLKAVAASLLGVPVRSLLEKVNHN